MFIMEKIPKHSLNSGEKKEILLSDLSPGKEYWIAITALDSLSLESELSSLMEVFYKAEKKNNSPVIDNIVYNSQVFVDCTRTGIIRCGGQGPTAIFFFPFIQISAGNFSRFL